MEMEEIVAGIVISKQQIAYIKSRYGLPFSLGDWISEERLKREKRIAILR